MRPLQRKRPGKRLRYMAVRRIWHDFAAFEPDGFAVRTDSPAVGRESNDRFFVLRADNLRAAVAVILLDFQSLKNVAPRHNPNEFGSAFGLRFVFKSRPAMKKILLMVALASRPKSPRTARRPVRLRKSITGHWMPACTIRP